MIDQRNKLQALWEERHRFNNFGEAIVRIRASGFRCHHHTIIECASPITAFCGLNGTGKSTLLHLAATAYQSPDPAHFPTYRLSDFLLVSKLDPRPFDPTAWVEYQYWQPDQQPKILTLSRDDKTKRWQGYPRRPFRRVFFVGVGVYLPKTEQRDFWARAVGRFDIHESTAVAPTSQEMICTILGQKYETILSNTVTHRQRTGTIVSVTRSTVAYSEAHMGYGEGRTQYLVTALEDLPPQSLVLIEEPETSLHPSAQFEFGRYLVDVAVRRHHQIFVATHSEPLLEAIPSQSRIYLARDPSGGVDPIVGLTALQANSLMADGKVKALNVLVEDPTAKAILSEILRRGDRALLRTIGITPAGDCDLIGRTVKALKDTGLPVAAVRDGDKGDEPKQNIFKLPGALPPEKELFACAAVRAYCTDTYGVDFAAFEASLIGVDHHEWFARLAAHVNLDESALIVEAARVYASNLPEADVQTLTNLLKEAQRR